MQERHSGGTSGLHDLPVYYTTLHVSRPSLLSSHGSTTMDCTGYERQDHTKTASNKSTGRAGANFLMFW